MGTVRGDLSVFGIANLLQTLTLGQNTGHLILEGATHQKVFYIHSGRVRLVHGSRRCARLDKLLRRMGPITPALADAGMIRPVLREWLLEEMSEVFGWLRSTFFYQEGHEVPKGILALPSSSTAVADVDVMTVLLESARRMDDIPRVRALLPDLEVIAEPNDAVEVDDSSFDLDVLQDVHPLIDGVRTIRQIVLTSVFPRHSVLHVLYRLRLQGAVIVRAGGIPAIQVPEMA